MKGLKLTVLAVALLGLSTTPLVMAKQPGDDGAKAKDKMERHTGGVGDRDVYANDKKAKKEKFKKDKRKEHADEFLMDDGEHNGKRKDKQEQIRGRDEDDRSSGLYKQHDKKVDQEQKELGQGSQQGQEMREQYSRKWWKFWE